MVMKNISALRGLMERVKLGVGREIRKARPNSPVDAII